MSEKDDQQRDDQEPPAGRRKTRGRPPGAKTEERPTAEGALTRCEVCGSTNRTPYTCPREVEHGGDGPDGPYTHVVWRNTRCADCGQARVDRTLENRPAPVTG